MKRVVGIDPGTTGGLALSVGQKLEDMEIMPEDITFTIALLKRWKPDIVYIERAQSMPGNGAGTMFKYGRGYGEILGALKALEIPYVVVPPKIWASYMHVGTPVKLKAKEKSKQVALQLFPYMNFLPTSRHKKPHDGLMDAAIITEYGRRVEYSEINHN